MIRFNRNCLVVVLGALLVTGWAGPLCAGIIAADSFTLTDGRDAGDQLQNFTTEIGGYPWITGSGNLQFAGDATNGVAVNTNNSAARTARIAVDMSGWEQAIVGAKFAFSKAFSATSTNHISVGLNDDNDHLVSSGLSIRVRQDGSWAIYHEASVRASGAITIADPDAFISVELTYDVQTKRASAKINNNVVATNVTLFNANVPTSYAGFTIGTGNELNPVDDFYLYAIVPEPGVAAMLGMTLLPLMRSRRRCR